jgi:predicted amidophosphoribosyltransferase
VLPPTVLDLSDRATPSLTAPPAEAAGVCAFCRNLISSDFEVCFRCSAQPQLLDVIVPVSVAVAGSSWYRTLRDYKTTSGPRQHRQRATIAAVLWRFLAAHEPCIARAAQISGFEIVTTVPSSSPRRDGSQPLRQIVSTMCWHTLARHRRVLRPAAVADPTRTFDPGRFESTGRLDGKSVLLIDDLWVTGAHAQSAAAALRSAGAGPEALVVLGRFLNPSHEHVVGRLNNTPFSWHDCTSSICAHSTTAAAA